MNASLLPNECWKIILLGLKMPENETNRIIQNEIIINVYSLQSKFFVHNHDFKSFKCIKEV
jgi:hypothetical protein